ncbi:MAG: acylphosphatase [Actinomycetota bacterium]|nr:acylphosphatase [Actinomycetota bacterium]
MIRRVAGHVQGVGYRWFVRGLAAAAGLAGSARNLADGRVEVVVEGSEDAVSALIAALDGPDAPGSVERLEVRDDVLQGVRGFTTA